MIARLQRLRDELGPMGLASIGLMAAAALFLVLVLKPLQARTDVLQLQLSSIKAPAQGGATVEKLGAFYSFLDKQEVQTDWLAKLYAIGKATGVEVQSASYRTQKAGERLERTEMLLPVAGSYSQIRDFLKRALAEIPVLSLDQMTLRRENRTEGVVHAELRMTLHLVKP
jgi:hypothetical protein